MTQHSAAHDELADQDPISQFVATRGVRSLGLIAFLIAMAGSVTLAEQYLETGSLLTGINFPLPANFLVPSMLAVLYLLRTERIKSAFALFLWSPVVLACYGGFTVAGLQTPILLLLPLIIMLSGWLLGAKQGWLMLALVTVMLSIMAWAETQGLLPPPLPRSPVVYALVFVTLSIVALVFGLTITANVREQYGKAVGLGRELTQANRELESRVALRTAELANALDTLRHLQDDLVQTEKLASLGSMVAGISHELNTPIGTAVTVISSLEHTAETLSASINGGTIKRSELSASLASIVQMSVLARRQMDRANALIASFKQVAIDQVSERRRDFDLHDLIDDLITALRPSWKTSAWTTLNEVPTGIRCDSFPGALGQIVTNVLQNAVLHGFSDRAHGQIRISAITDNNAVELVMEDDGIGMDTATQLRAFEPFFTTKLGKGGSGLGLALSHRIASTVLAGELRVTSASGNGSRFMLKIPLRTPGKL